MTSFIASRPILIFLFLAVVLLVLPSIIIPFWSKTTKTIQNDVGLISENLRSGLASKINAAETIFSPSNASAVKLAALLDSSLNRTTKPTFDQIRKKIVPNLFQAYTFIPYVSQVSYTGPDGLFFALFTEENQTLALFANSTFSSGSTKNYTWYIQHTDDKTGNLQGEAKKFQPLDTTNSTWFRGAKSSGSKGFAELGTGWSSISTTGNRLLLNSVSLYQSKGVVSLGFPVKALTDFFQELNFYGGDFYLSTLNGEMLVPSRKNASFIFSDGAVHVDGGSDNIRCVLGDSGDNNVMEIGNSSYWLLCSILEIAGVPLVSVSMFPHEGILQSNITKRIKTSVILLSLNLAILLILISAIFFFFVVRAEKRETQLRANLINQMEATQQAERKSMNKSLAFASASHDIRASLAGINGLIELCNEEVDRGSEVETNLRQMKGCTQDLVALLNSILDMSKIEAGKMQLDEEDFNMPELLEEVVDSFHPVGMKKSVDVVLDPHDGSLHKFPTVRGDRAKLKQILNNLVGNAVKFTSDGHVSLRAWVRKPSPDSSVVLTGSGRGCSTSDGDSGGLLKWVPFWFGRKSGRAEGDGETADGVDGRNLNSMEFVFEVDDTGKGIPKDRQKSVFENYVQVRETAKGQQGTGLGLGIVQSLVRLMGGEIGIVDKETGQPGTLFRFNIFLTISETGSAETTLKPDIESNGGDCLSTTPNPGLKIQTSTRSLSLRNLSPRLNNILLSSSPKPDGSRVVLLIKNDERRRIAVNHFENLGVNVTAVDRLESLISVFKRIKSKIGECGSRSDLSSSSSKDFPLSSMEGTDYKIQTHKRRNSNVPGFVLIVIDAKAGTFSEIQNAVEWFRGGMHKGTCCRVVWLNRPSQRESIHDETDIYFLKPLHGSRLQQVTKMLPEFGGLTPKKDKSSKNIQNSVAEKPPRSNSVRERSPRSNTELHETMMREDGESRNRSSRKSEEKVLKGKRVLLAEDHPVSAMLAKRKLKHFGASTVDHCVNGLEAVALVTDRLGEQRKHKGSPDDLPFDYIFMDCEMPDLDGYEATKLIREKEKRYGIHIPIIAVTAHEGGSEEVRKAIRSGMDVHLGKQMEENHVAEAIRYIHSLNLQES